MSKKIITICSSASFYKEVVEIEKKLKKLGFKVIIPITAKRMKKENNFDVSGHKTWYQNPNDYKIKARLMKGHFDKVINSDAILVINLEKNGNPGYIGPNALIEMAFAFYYKKPIFIFDNISKTPFEEEILAMNPIFLSGDLSKINLR